MALLSAMPRVRSLYSRYFSTIGATSLCAFAVLWYFAESLTISGEARALVSSSYRASIWSKRSNIGIFRRDVACYVFGFAAASVVAERDVTGYVSTAF